MCPSGRERITKQFRKTPNKYLLRSIIYMEVELELLTSETDEIQVMQKMIELAKKAKELGFSIKEFELEAEGDGDEDEEQ
jgi:hypothetical protein